MEKYRAWNTCLCVLIINNSPYVLKKKRNWNVILLLNKRKYNYLAKRKCNAISIETRYQPRWLVALQHKHKTCHNTFLDTYLKGLVAFTINTLISECIRVLSFDSYTVSESAQTIQQIINVI